MIKLDEQEIAKLDTKVSEFIHAILIPCSPQIVMFALDRQKYLIQVPLVAWPRTAATELMSIRLTKLAAPFADRLIGHGHAVFQQ